MTDKQEHDDKMYGLVCEKRFDSIDKKQDDILNLLRGKNCTPGLIDDVRTLKGRWKIIFGALTILFTALVVQIIRIIL
jgi:hypothetical protein